MKYYFTSLESLNKEIVFYLKSLLIIFMFKRKNTDRTSWNMNLVR